MLAYFLVVCDLGVADTQKHALFYTLTHVHATAICECHCQHEEDNEHNFWDKVASLLPLWVPGTKLRLSRFAPEVLLLTELSCQC